MKLMYTVRMAALRPQSRNKSWHFAIRNRPKGELDAVEQPPPDNLLILLVCTVENSIYRWRPVLAPVSSSPA